METIETEKQRRDRQNGQYAAKLEAPCRCGHTCGDHTAARVGGIQPCCADGCQCSSFKRSRKK